MKANETELRSLRCDFTQEELREFSKTMARAAEDLSAAEDHKKVATAQFAEEIARQRSVVGQMARHINNGYEMRMVKCRVDLDSPARGTARITRLDTGELLAERAMTEWEIQKQMQAELPLPKEESKTEQSGAASA